MCYPLSLSPLFEGGRGRNIERERPSLCSAYLRSAPPFLFFGRRAPPRSQWRTGEGTIRSQVLGRERERVRGIVPPSLSLSLSRDAVHRLDVGGLPFSDEGEV